jgi:hypothetical protein
MWHRFSAKTNQHIGGKMQDKDFSNLPKSVINGHTNGNFDHYLSCFVVPAQGMAVIKIVPITA